MAVVCRKAAGVRCGARSSTLDEGDRTLGTEHGPGEGRNLVPADREMDHRSGQRRMEHAGSQGSHDGGMPTRPTHQPETGDRAGSSDTADRSDMSRHLHGHPAAAGRLNLNIDTE